VGHVVDFISTPWLLPAIYNVADIAIVTSMVIFMILTIRGIGLDGNKVEAVSKTATPTVSSPRLQTDAETPDVTTSDRPTPGAEARP
jgi:signal peptidase II